jgi:hydroxymethylglutaryl-CoA lyase
MDLPESVELIEVCPRDGFQNVADLIPFDAKVAIIEKLARAGYKRMEFVSFVSPKAIPQMADAKEVAAAVMPVLRENGVKSAALVPNRHGVEDAIECGIDEITYVISVSEKHNLANVRRTPAESMEQFQLLIKKYGSQIRFRLSLATALGSPFNEVITLAQVRDMVKRGFDLGCKEVMLADTVGIATPRQVNELLSPLVAEFGSEPIMLHLHDTRGLALANTYAAMQLGIRKFDVAAGGLGGCPFAPGAAGNVAAEDVLNMMAGLGVETGINKAILKEAIALIRAQVHAPIVSHMASLKDA